MRGVETGRLQTMSSWAELTDELQKLPPDQRGPWIVDTAKASLEQLAAQTNRNVIVYASGYLQKPQVPGIFLSVNGEDLNGFMTSLYRMDCSRGLLLVLHTPGGSAEAAESIVEYLRSKFDEIDVLIPAFAMSAGTMISLSADRLIMGRQSQLGPTDPQLIMNNAAFSAHSIVEQFDEAKAEIAKNPDLARAWAPVLQPFGPALLQNARKALSYGQTLVQRWLERNMFKSHADPAADARAVATFFSGNSHGSHGRRIDRSEARAQGLTVLDLEDDDVLQSAALTLYHALTIAFESGPAAKIIMSTNGNSWIKNFTVAGKP